MKHNHLLSKTLCLLFICVYLVSCSGATQVPSDTQEPLEESVFTGAMPEDILTLDPHKSIAISEDTVLPLIWEALVAIGPDGTWQGVLAESWEVSSDGLTWVFHLHRGARFHNGREMTGDDVIYSFNRILDENTGATMQSVFSNKIITYEAVDQYTVRFKLSTGGGTFLSELGLGVRAAIIARECVNPDGAITQPIGTGPYIFDSWTPGEEWRAHRFDDYWGESAKINEVIFVPIPDDTARLTALQTGTVDWIRGVPYHQVAAMQQDAGFTIRLTYQSNTLRLNFNSTRPPFNDPRVRQAVAYAIDKNEINQALFFDLGNVHNQPFVPDSFLYLNIEDIYGTPNLDRAQELMVEAGYAAGFEVTVVHPAGWLDGIWEVIGDQLRPLNIQLNVELLEGAEGPERIMNLDYDMFLDQQSSIFSWDRTFGYFSSDSNLNWLVGGYSNEKVTELLSQGRNETNLEKAKAIYTEILQILQDDAAALFILAIPDVQAWQPWLEGFEPNQMNAFLVWPDGGLTNATISSREP